MTHLPVWFIAAAIPPHHHVGWSDTEVLRYVLGAVGGTLALLVPVAWGLVKILTRNAERRAVGAEAQCRQLRRALDAAEDAEGLGAKLEAATCDANHLRETLEQVRAQAEGFQRAAEGLVGERDDACGQLEAEQRRVRKALQRGGATWTEKVLSNAPEFKPLDPAGRRTPVISLLNLKGGVGKTTATANLGAALSGRGWRVLLVDLDLQGSLTAMFLNEGRQQELFRDHRLLGDFLDASFDGDFPNILDYATEVLPASGSMLVPTTDVMAYAETNLTVRWFLKESKRDPRFLLRRELQLKRVTNEFDIVLLDCPPFINVSCVNALAASDYVLVPVNPSKQVTDRVTILMERVKEFHDNLNTDLKVMGFFANRTKESTLTSDERNRLTALRDRCRDTWAAAPLFDSFIRQSVEIRQAEDEQRPLGPDDEVYQSFVRLAREVESRLPMFCRPAPHPVTAEAAR